MVYKHWKRVFVQFWAIRSKNIIVSKNTMILKVFFSQKGNVNIFQLDRYLLPSQNTSIERDLFSVPIAILKWGSMLESPSKVHWKNVGDWFCDNFENQIKHYNQKSLWIPTIYDWYLLP